MVLTSALLSVNDVENTFQQLLGNSLRMERVKKLDNAF